MLHSQLRVRYRDEAAGTPEPRWRANTALAQTNVETSRIERQAAEIEQATHRRFRIGRQLLVA